MPLSEVLSSTAITERRGSLGGRWADWRSGNSKLHRHTRQRVFTPSVTLDSLVCESNRNIE